MISRPRVQHSIHNSIYTDAFGKLTGRGTEATAFSPLHGIQSNNVSSFRGSTVVQAWFSMNLYNAILKLSKPHGGDVGGAVV